MKEGSNERQGKGVPGATHTTKERRCSLFQGVICDDREFFQKFRERRSRVISSPPFRFAAPGFAAGFRCRVHCYSGSPPGSPPGFRRQSSPPWENVPSATTIRQLLSQQLLSGDYCRATTIGQLLSRQLLSSATTIRPEEAHLTTALAFLWYFCYFTTVPIVRNRHAVVYAPKATRKCTKKPRRKSKTTRFPEGHRLVQTEFKPRASSTRVTGTGSANSGSRICS